MYISCSKTLQTLKIKPDPWKSTYINKAKLHGASSLWIH